MAESNPNGSNATLPDPRQQICWDFYVESVSKGFPNATESAIKAGYEPSTAKDITSAGWFLARKEQLKRRGMYSKAERNLDKILDIDYEEDGKIRSDVLRVVADVSKSIVTTLGKDDGYSTKTETDLTSGGEKIAVNVIAYGNNIASPILTEELPATPA